MAQSAPTLSVITVARNSERTVGRALESVARQEGVTEGAVEHWVIDGASSDRTVEIARSFPHVQVLSEPDNGIADAFNKGLRVSKGEWILFLNSDDQLADSQVIREFLPMLKPEYDFVYGMISIVDGGADRVVRIGGRDGAWKWLHQRMTLPHPATFMNRRYVERFGGFDPDFRIAMDYELVLRGYRDSRFRFVPRFVNRFSSGGTSTSGRGLQQAFECYRAKRKNKVGSLPSRLFWLSYQGFRMTFEPLFSRIPLVGLALRRLARVADRRF